MAERTVASAGREQQGVGREGTRAQERHVLPPVDIYETPSGLVLKADLPGVSREALQVRVDNGVLTIRGQAQHIAPGEALRREYGLNHFFRQFELSEEVDQGKVRAELKHGVLTLQLPKVAKAAPRRIEVKVD
ncbi:MAG: Hsp20/alpha crystallin family protein [Thermodesulfobacteriota bacterium]|jgi:HSP20 family molecular chaperone IbpA